MPVLVLSVSLGSGALAADRCVGARDSLLEPEPIELIPHTTPADGPTIDCGTSGPLLEFLSGEGPFVETPPPEGLHPTTIAGRPAVVQILSDAVGSGGYSSWHLVQAQGHACIGSGGASWRAIRTATPEQKRAAGLVPLPVFADPDQDGKTELITTTSLLIEPEYGAAGSGLGLVARQLDGTRWVSDPAATRVMAAKLAQMYQQLSEERGTPLLELAWVLEAVAEERDPCPWPFPSRSME